MPEAIDHRGELARRAGIAQRLRDAVPTRDGLQNATEIVLLNVVLVVLINAPGCPAFAIDEHRALARANAGGILGRVFLTTAEFVQVVLARNALVLRNRFASRKLALLRHLRPGSLTAAAPVAAARNLRTPQPLLQDPSLRENGADLHRLLPA